MELTYTIVDNSRPLVVDVQFNVPAEFVARAQLVVLTDLQKDKSFKVAGYRAGKLPLEVIKRYRQGDVNDGILRLISSECTRKFASEQVERIATLVAFEVTRLDNGDLLVNARYEFAPHFDLSKLDGKEYKRPVVNIEAGIEEMILALRQQIAHFEEKKSDAELDNLVKVRVKILNESGEDVTISLLGSDEITYVLGTYDLPSEFTSNLIGRNPGDKVDFLWVHDDKVNETVTEFKVEAEILELQERVLPNVDEKFIETFLQRKGTLEDLKDVIRKNIEREVKVSQNSYDELHLTNLVAEVYKDITLPESQLLDLTQRLKLAELHRTWQRDALEKLTEDEAKELLDGLDNEFFTNVARKSLTMRFFVEQIGLDNGVKVEESEIDDYIASLSIMFENPRDFINSMKENKTELEKYANSIYNSKIFEIIRSHLNVVDEPVTYTNLIRSIRAI